MDSGFQQGNPSGSEDEREEDSDQEGQQGNKYQVYDQQSDSDTDEKRTVRTEKQKRWAKLKDIKLNISQKMKINDFNALYTEFDALTKEFDKSKRVVEKVGIPVFYVQTLYLLQTYLTNFPNDEKKKLSKANNLSFNKMKHQLKKYNALYQKEIDEYEKNPVDPSEDEEEEKKEGEKHKKHNKPGEDDEGDSQKSDSDDIQNEESSSESDEDEQKQYLRSRLSNDPMERRKFWLKKQVSEEDEEKERNKNDEEEENQLKQLKDKMEKRYLINKLRKENQLAGLNKEKQVAIDISPEAVNKKMHEIVENRAKKMNLKEYYETLTAYKKQLKFTKKIDELEILYLFIQVSVDHGKNQSTGYLTQKIWSQILEDLTQYLYILSELKEKQQEIQILNFSKDVEVKETNLFEALCASFLILEEDLNVDFVKLDPQTQYQEYQTRVNDLYRLMKLAKITQDFFQKWNQTEKAARIAFKRLQNTYYIHDNTLKQLREQAIADKADLKNQIFEVLNTEELMQALATMVYKQKDDENNLKTTLYLVYHHCIHGRISKAKDILQMNDLPDAMKGQNNKIQILYNRILIQLGLAHLKEGNLSECKDFLELFYCKEKSQRVRDLIGQPFRTIDIYEKKKHLLPYHQHINLEVVELCYYLCLAIIDPNFILHSPARPMNQNFNGPSETNKDFLFDAAQALATGNWQTCYNNIEKLTIWAKFPDVTGVKEKILQKVKEEAYKNYIICNFNSLEILSLKKMCELFDMSLDQIISTTNKIIFHKSYVDTSKADAKDMQLIMKKFDNEFYLEFTQNQKTELQKLAQKLIENAQKSTDIIEQKLSEYSGSNDQRQGDQYNKDKQYNYKGQNRYQVNLYGSQYKKNFKSQNRQRRVY